MGNKICPITKKELKEEGKTITYSGQKMVVSKEAIELLNKKLGEDVVSSLIVENL